MNLKYLGDALDHWKGGVLATLQEAAAIKSIVIDPLLTDPSDWLDEDYRVYERLLRVPHGAALRYASQGVRRIDAVGEIPRESDVFLDPDTGIATSRVKNKSQYVQVVDVIRHLFNGCSRVVVVYQHISRIKAPTRVNAVMSEFPDDISWCSYESPSAALLFTSLDPKRIERIVSALSAELSRHALSRVRSNLLVHSA